MAPLAVRPPRSSPLNRWSVIALFAVTACTDRLVGFEAEYSSNVLAVVASPPQGGALRFTVPATATTVDHEPVEFDPDGVLVHLKGYLPMAPDSIVPLDDRYEILMTLPRDLVAQTDGGLPRIVQAIGDLYLPGHRVRQGADGTLERAPATAWQVGVSVNAVYTGPITRLLARLQGFFRGLYSAR